MLTFSSESAIVNSSRYESLPLIRFGCCHYRSTNYPRLNYSFFFLLQSSLRRNQLLIYTYRFLKYDVSFVFSSKFFCNATTLSNLQLSRPKNSIKIIILGKFLLLHLLHFKKASVTKIIVVTERVNCFHHFWNI